MNATVAIIGGTGFETPLLERFGRPLCTERVNTDYGAADVAFLAASGGQIAFLPRHGGSHNVAPHRINHKANIAALRACGVKSIFSTSAVGALRADYEPGDLVLVDDFVDMRRGLPITFFDHPPVVHADFTDPFSPRLRALLRDSAEAACANTSTSSTIIHPCGTYVSVDGPRYETPAEVRMFALWGADVVGMTVAAEAILAREVGIEYASVAVVTNLGTGLSQSPLSHADVELIMSERRPLILAVLLDAVRKAYSGPNR